ncbi:MAG: S-adenosylmethionine:tRNA ribosyltransferase-isomerase, partial [Proteobacteria bacterium]|nr:S-adenosylmethionine:tRNA ribosyltransferase-isomerase [Pseudomonadota bacterium]
MDRIADYDYALPPGSIAQKPLPQRDQSRLLVLDPVGGQWADQAFGDLVRRLGPEHLLVLNDTRVVPARLEAVSDNGRPIEFLVLPRPDQMNDPEPEVDCLVRPAKKVRQGRTFVFSADFEARVLTDPVKGRTRAAFRGQRPLAEALADHGQTPLPPYIRRPTGPDEADRERYQTVYARAPGSVAAPTAGLHFTPELLEALEAGGVGRADITLHVGVGTFAPVRTEALAEHRMEAEFFDITPRAAASINAAREAGKRVVAVGTTVVRALESAADETAPVTPALSMAVLPVTAKNLDERVAAT